METDEELLAGAPQRIERHRKADVEIRVVDAAGKPVPNAEVSVEQTNHAFLFGAAAFRVLHPVPELRQAFRQRFAELWNYGTIPFYWPWYEREPGKPDHAQNEAIARWCQENHIATKGHTLAWNVADPSWLPDDLDEIHRLQMERISEWVTRFRGSISRWDAINEVTQYDRKGFAEGSSPKLSAMWKKVGAVEFARECFLQARRANPEAFLLINDFYPRPEYERLIEQLVDSQGKRLYDAIGIQSHMHLGVWSNTKIWEVCEEFARFGVPIHLTEVTILSGKTGLAPPKQGSWTSTPEGEERQAAEAARFYTMLFSHPSVGAITYWDFSDDGAWLGAPSGLLRADMAPKPAYEALRKLIKHDWWTQTQVRTDAQGHATVRGFLGTYRVVARCQDRQVVQEALTLSSQGPSQWSLVLSP